ncbi:MAG: hypothetical protein P1U77_25115, partial [Rubripirellula sp.]|nr:hypothetical protein [Rubripirellula sp.]
KLSFSIPNRFIPAHPVPVLPRPSPVLRLPFSAFQYFDRTGEILRADQKITQSLRNDFDRSGETPL